MLQLVERGFFKSAAIKLSVDGVTQISPDVQILRVGKFNHPKYGEFEISTQTLAEMKKNFDSRVRGVDIAFDYFHNSDQEASGWPTELFLTEGGTELWAKVDWTNEARRKLAEREIRYFSPDFAFEWEDPESGVAYKNVLFGGGLTNRPFVKDMAAIVAAEQERDQMTLKELEDKVTKLAEENAVMKKKLEEMSDEDGRDKSKEEVEKLDEKDAGEEDKKDDSSDEDSVPNLKKKLAEMQKKCEEYEEKFKQADAAKQMAEKEKEFNVLLTEGKACAAQKESFLKGDMGAFIKLAQPLNLKPNGSSNAADGGTTGERDERVLKLAEKIAEDKKIPLHKAIGLANKEIK